MTVAIVTGSSGLIGSEAVRFFHRKGMEVVGIDNNMREYFFGPEGSVKWNTARLEKELSHFTHLAVDIRDEPQIESIFRRYGENIELILHSAAQPSHDWAALEPMTDFSVNATGTMVMLECARKHTPEACFIYTSTNKVYGDTPNRLPIEEWELRWELAKAHPYGEFGIDETMSIDQSKHSLFGCSKAAADVMVQEYGRYFDMKTGTFRGGCLTGPAHSGVELHGFLAYLVKCIATGKPYTVFGHKGKQLRDNIHSYDLISAFWEFFQNPRRGEVYNIGGSRHSNCSMLEAIKLGEELVGEELDFTLSDQARAGDHIWWISDVRKFQAHYPGWEYKYDLMSIMKEIVDAVRPH